MTAIDYESEYDNRARVPEHPQIIAEWEADAAAYRAVAIEDGRAELGISYGPTARQTIDLLAPKEGGATPLAMFIHGGYWRSLEASTFSHMARGLNGHGITVAVVDYDLCPQVRIADIINEMRRACLYLWRRFGRKVTVYGHSAGGRASCGLHARDRLERGRNGRAVRPCAGRLRILRIVRPVANDPGRHECGFRAR